MPELNERQLRFLIEDDRTIRKSNGAAELKDARDWIQNSTLPHATPEDLVLPLPAFAPAHRYIRDIPR